MTLKLSKHHMLNKMDTIFSINTLYIVRHSKANFYLLCLPALEEKGLLGFFSKYCFTFLLNLQTFNSKNYLFCSLPPIFEIKYYDTGIYPLFSYWYFFIDYICVLPCIKMVFWVSMWSLKREEIHCFNNPLTVM